MKGLNTSKKALFVLICSLLVPNILLSQDPAQIQAKLYDLRQKVRINRALLKAMSLSDLQSYAGDIKSIRDELNDPHAFEDLENQINAVLVPELAKRKIALEKKRERVEEPIPEPEEVEVAVEKRKPDRFTQSGAHLSLPRIRSKVKMNYDIEPYLNIVTRAMARESKHKDTHYVFYHALDNVWIATQDVYKKLHEYLFPMTRRLDTFQFLRWGSIGYEGSAQEFVVDQLRHHSLIDDTSESIKAFLISVNLALFGNAGQQWECTWEYFMNPKSHAQPSPEVFKSILDVFGIDHKYVGELMQLSTMIRTSEQTLLQIFVPIEKVDQVAYLSWVQGVPAHEETIQWALKRVARKRYMTLVITELQKIYQEEGIQNPAFKDLLERAEKGEFSVDHFLRIYRNTPWKIKNINYLQARLVLSRDMLLNPASGIKFFRYSTLTRQQRQNYERKLNEVIRRIATEFLAKQAKETAAGG